MILILYKDIEQSIYLTETNIQKTIRKIFSKIKYLYAKPCKEKKENVAVCQVIK